MKIKIIFIGLFVLFSFWCKAQSQNIDNLHKKIGHTLDDYREQSKLVINKNTLSDDYEQAYEKLKKLYIKKQESENTKKSNKLLSAFTKKMNIDDERMLFDIRNYANILEWITYNIDSTSFQNIEEATKEYEEYLEMIAKEYENNKEFYTYMLATVNKFGGEIFAEVALDYEMNNPNSTVNKSLYNRP